MTYGNAEYYANLFADIMCDVDHNDQAYGDAIVDGFVLALHEWRDYHAKQVDECNRVEQRVHQALAV